MCEAFVQIVDRVGVDPYHDVGLFKTGHVVVVMEDGWSWTTTERTAPDWRIVSLPGVPAAALDALVRTECQQRILDAAAAGTSDLLANPATNPMLQIRAWQIDLSSLPAGIKNAVLAPRTGSGVLVATQAQINGALKRMAARTNTSVTG